MLRPYHPGYDSAHREACRDWTVQGWAERRTELGTPNTVVMGDEGERIIQEWLDKPRDSTANSSWWFWKRRYPG